MPSIGFALSQSTATQFDNAINQMAAFQKQGALVIDLRKGDEQGHPTGVIEVSESPIPMPGTTEIFSDRTKAIARENELRQAGKIVRRIVATAAKVMDMRTNPPKPLVSGQELFHLIHHDD
jgi:hypothetical protein